MQYILAVKISMKFLPVLMPYLFAIHENTIHVKYKCFIHLVILS